MSKLKTVNIKGKEYVEVHTRIKEFHRLYPTGCIQSSFERIEVDGDVLWIVVAKVIPDSTVPDRYFIGHAQELESASFINKTSALENAETSAWGRAMSALNIGIDTGVASADEVSKAINRERKPSASRSPKKPIGKDTWFVQVAYGHNEDIKKIEGRQFISEKKMWAVPATEESRQALFVMNTKKGIKKVYDINGEEVSVDMSPEQNQEVQKEAFNHPF